MDRLNESILSQGERIKKIRKILGVRQQELAGEKITRSLISYIENGKTKLVKETAEIIADNINKIAKERDINYSISADDLMKDREQQAIEILDNIILKIKTLNNDQGNFNIELEKAKTILNEWQLPSQKAVIYDIIGNYYYNLFDYYTSYINYMIALESYIRVSDYIGIVETFLNLAKCNLNLKQYEQVINTNNYALTLLEKQKQYLHPFIKKAIFNNAIAYNELRMYDKCISELCKLEIQFNDLSEQQIIDILTLKANSYVEKGELEIALTIYQDIINKTDEANYSTSLTLVYANLAELYIKKRDIDKSKEYFYKTMDLSKRVKTELYDTMLYNLGVAYRKANYFDLAIECLNDAKKSAIKNNNIQIVINIYEELMKIYMQAHLDKLIIDMIEKVKNLANQYKNDVAIKNVNDIFIMAGYYFIEKNTSLSKSFLDLAIQSKIK